MISLLQSQTCTLHQHESNLYTLHQHEKKTNKAPE